MTAEKSKLDALRIDRSAEEGRPRSAWPWIAGLVLVLVLAFAVWWSSGPAVVEVRTVPAREAESGGSQTVLNASGYVTARLQATVSSKVTGKVVEVLIEEGMEVEEGQVLARLDPTNVEVSLRLAQAGLEASRGSLVETEVRLHEAGLELTRVENLMAEGVASKADLDRALAARDALAARLEQQQSQVSVDKRQVDLWRRELEDRTIRAPFSGVVVAKNAQPGEMISPVSAGGGFTRTGIGTLVDMESLEIEVDVNEAYIQRVAPAQPVLATLDAYPDWPISCRVIAIIPTADRQRATVRVRIAFNELDPRILPDMGVKVAFQEESGEEVGGVVIVVPAGAVVEGQEGRGVVWIAAGEKAERRAVRLGAVRDADRTLLSGVQSGERVIVDPPEGLQDGDQVEERSR